ncbi:acidic repeat-containing protein-like [Eutrema salsugineum]|uniref:acidic repeat-containing protein-like n=1 Tax=Eutrema salsugineum TaxID=72664 RepID=UPI000CED7929|nr:acidic repeat-containing protein-like [Eutrema salsugineum]
MGLKLDGYDSDIDSSYHISILDHELFIKGGSDRVNTKDSDSDDTEVLSGRGTDDDYGFEDYMGSDSETGEDTDDMDQTDEYDSEDDFIDDDETCEESDGSSDSSEDDSGDDEDEDGDDADPTDDNENDDEDVMLDDETDIDDDSEDQRNVELSDILIEKNISISGHQDSVLQTWVHMLISKRSSLELILSDEQGVKIQATVSDGEISVASSRIDVGKITISSTSPTKFDSIPVFQS